MRLQDTSPEELNLTTPEHIIYPEDLEVKKTEAAAFKRWSESE